MVDDRGELGHVRDAALHLASREAARVILYDRDAAKVLGDPMPTSQSAQGEAEQFGDPLSAADLEKLGQGALARMVTAAHASGVDAWGWLPSDAGVGELLRYAQAHGAEAVLLPNEPEQPGLLDRLLGRSPDDAIAAARQATGTVAVALVGQDHRLRWLEGPAGG
jgi:nucleotide-binding universal stress UspA family protein